MSSASAQLPASYRIYEVLRRGVPRDAAVLGHGRNLVEVPMAVSAVLANPTLSQRLTYYATDLDAAEDAAIAAILAEVLGLRGVQPDDVFITEGSSKGISAVFQAVESSGCPVALPLPTYFAHELSARRRHLPIWGYYRPDTGATAAIRDASDAGCLLLEMIPNGITGSLTSKPQRAGEPTLTLVDSVFAVGMPSDGPSPWSQLARRDLARTVLTLTVSKDLSSPGLRAGLLVTKNAEVKEAVRRDRLETTFSVCVLARPVVLLYVLAIAAHELRVTSGATSEAATSRVLELATRAANASVLPDHTTLASVLQHFDVLIDRYTSNWALAQTELTRCGAFAAAPDIGYSTWCACRPRCRSAPGVTSSAGSTMPVAGTDSNSTPACSLAATGTCGARSTARSSWCA